MPRMFRAVIACGILWGVSAAGIARGATPNGLVVSPGSAELRGASARQQLIATGTVEGRPLDLTRQVGWRSETPDVVAVDPAGVAHAVGDGEGIVVASLGGHEARATLRVGHTGEASPPTLERDILPMLTRAGCNAGACHGKARG